MRTTLRRCCWFPTFLLVSALFSICFPPRVHADGGAPNLAYISGTPAGVSVIDVQLRKITKVLSVAGDPHTILLSLDGRFLYVTQPGLGEVSVILVETGRPVCTTHLPGEPAFLALDQYSNILYAAGNGAARVTALDPMTCAVRHIYQIGSSVNGLAVTVVATGSSVNHQLWVAGMDALTVFDGLTEQQIGKIPIPDGPEYLSLPPGETAYVSTRRGTVDAVDISTRAVNQLLTGGVFGPMDYDALTGEVYVPDEKHNLLAILTPVFDDSPLPKEPDRIIHTNAPPESVAITNDGLLGFIALRGGQVVMLDLLSRQVAYTVAVGGTPHFVITGLYPPSTYITPSKGPAKQEPTHGMITSNTQIIVAFVLAMVFLVLVLILLRPLQKRRS
jgi:DNA-binding beta-propeller fold protein YncE